MDIFFSLFSLIHPFTTVSHQSKRQCVFNSLQVNSYKMSKSISGVLFLCFAITCPVKNSCCQISSFCYHLKYIARPH
uniref:Uncharacterized protein n=1 Tax=Octopus bimaculoides TaxID=37653 RepID=A0A0L8H7C3_OCTBM